MKKLNLKYIVLILFSTVSLIFGVIGCSPDVAEDGELETLKVYTTFYPLYDFAKKIGGDRINVINMVPSGVEPHDFEPSPRQVAELSKARVFIYLGEPMDTWAEKIGSQLDDKSVKVLEAGEGLIQDDDPHIWLDPIIAKKLSHRIYGVLSDADRENKGYYRENMLNLGNRLDELDKEYREGLSDISKRDVVVSHAALGYLARRYGLNQIPITGLSPQEEPSPRKMAELSSLGRQKGIEYIFFERLASTKLSETLAREIGAKLLVFNPLGSLSEDDIKSDEDYFSIMEENLKNLEKALK